MWRGWLAGLNKTSEAGKEVTKLTRKAGREVGGYRKAQRRQRQRKLNKRSARLVKVNAGQQAHGVVVRRGLGRISGESPQEEISRNETEKLGGGIGGLLRRLQNDSQRAMPRIEPRICLNTPNTFPWNFLKSTESTKKSTKTTKSTKGNRRKKSTKTTKKIDENDEIDEQKRRNRRNQRKNGLLCGPHFCCFRSSISSISSNIFVDFRRFFLSISSFS